jgi:diguanylate cyclase (GGDEF)-like protein
MPIYLLHRYIPTWTGNISGRYTRATTPEPEALMIEQLLYQHSIIRPGHYDRSGEPDRFNIAVRQSNVDVVSRLEDTLSWSEPRVHPFLEFDELFRLAQKHMLDMILFASSDAIEVEVEMIARAKERPSLAVVPTVIYHPSPDKDVYIRSFQAGTDDVLAGVWDSEIFGVRIRMLAERSKRDLGVNPTSKLPGPILIEKEIDRQLRMGNECAVCYLDIDNFKAYNDHYGYVYGDSVIRLTAHIIRDIVFDVVPDGFVGHVGGDDFVYVIPYDKVEIVNSFIIKTFDAIIPYRYKLEDRERGKIVAKNRRGEDEVFPLLTVSIAIAVNVEGSFTHVGEMSHMLADLKKYTKNLAGSNYMIERRRKY